ncbi:hypothetical protein [Parachitinimonas caeni]|uniref:Uncharacterized protein n=1 Tax=Parachitinimonas caeni TaxID=3031301 RepID=A0ABT7DSX1_9NEIS|nr:hypothetical protein [Parachitinimonas caeni]MDK2123171.1 hypothetical protein [Parachitinimonas caeni]
MKTYPAHPRPRSQRGNTILLFLLVAGVGLMSLILSKLNTPNNQTIREQQGTQPALNLAKTALMGWALGRDDNLPVPPGLLPYPDRNADGNYDGFADCPSGAAPLTNNLFLGKLAWQGEIGPCESRDAGMPRQDSLSGELRDGAGERLWYVASQNVLDDAAGGSYTNLPGTAGNRYITPANLKTPPLHPWLTVCNANGQVLSNQVAFIVIAPGEALTGQVRNGAAPAPANYLDRYTISGGTPPCNGVINHAVNNLVFVNADPTNSFNDRIAYVTRDQFIDQLAQRLTNGIRQKVDQYRATHGSYPSNLSIAVIGSWLVWDDQSDSNGLYSQIPTTPPPSYYQVTGPNIATLRMQGCNSIFSLTWNAASNSSTVSRAPLNC